MTDEEQRTSDPKCPVCEGSDPTPKIAGPNGTCWYCHGQAIEQRPSNPPASALQIIERWLQWAEHRHLKGDEYDQLVWDSQDVIDRAADETPPAGILCEHCGYMFDPEMFDAHPCVTDVATAAPTCTCGVGPACPVHPPPSPERLRAVADHVHSLGAYTQSWEIMRAADEIERLRHDIDRALANHSADLTDKK